MSGNFEIAQKVKEIQRILELFSAKFNMWAVGSCSWPQHVALRLMQLAPTCGPRVHAAGFNMWPVGS